MKKNINLFYNLYIHKIFRGNLIVIDLCNILHNKAEIGA